MEMEKSQEIKSKTLLGEFWSIDLTMHLLEGAKNDFYTHSQKFAILLFAFPYKIFEKI